MLHKGTMIEAKMWAATGLETALHSKSLKWPT